MIFLVVAVQVILFLPYAEYILLPWSSIGSESEGVVITAAGIVLGAVNNFLRNYIESLVATIGFHTREGVESMTLFLNFLMTLVNTLLNLSILMYTIQKRNGQSF